MALRDVAETTAHLARGAADPGAHGDAGAPGAHGDAGDPGAHERAGDPGAHGDGGDPGAHRGPGRGGGGDAGRSPAAGPGWMSRGVVTARMGHLLRPAVILPAVFGIGGFVVAWQIVAEHNKYLIPTVGAITRSLRDLPHLYFFDMLGTLRETVVGFTASFVVAFSLAVGMCHLKIVERAVMPLAVILSVTPIVAITPGLVIAFGFGALPKYIVTALIVFFPLLINSLVGLRSVDPAALDFFRTVHASPAEILWRLRVPSSLPFLFAAFRVCLPLSLIGAVVAEFLAAGQTPGLGVLIQVANGSNNLVEIYAATFLLAVLGLLLTLAVVVVERSVLSWHPSKRQGS